MRFNRMVAVGAILVAVALVAVGCGDSGDGDNKTSNASGSNEPKSLTIGAFNFSESAILANIYADALRAKGYSVKVRTGLGNREVVAPALQNGEFDLYPGYAATDLEFYNKAKGEATPDKQATTDKLNSYLKPKGLQALTPSDAIDANAFAVTKATADKYQLKTLTDLAKVSQNLTLGGPAECPTRPFCEPGLKKTYGITFKSFRPLDAGGPLSKQALENGDVDVALIFSSDGAIPAKGFVVLEDDKHLQNADNVVPIIRTKVATAKVVQTLNDVDAKLTTADLTQLNKRADVDKEDPEKLASEWAKDHGFST